MNIKNCMSDLSGKDISIVIPSYKDSHRLMGILEDLTSSPFFAGAEIIIAADDDRSVFDVIKQFGDIKITYSDTRRGKGRGIIDGFKICTRPQAGFIDADKPICLEEFRSLFGMLGPYDCVIASRRVAGASISSHPPMWRRISSRAFNLMFRTLFGIRIWDTQCGAKAFRRQTLLDVIPSLTERGWTFDIDIIVQFYRRHYSILEFPVEWHYISGSRIKLADIWEMFLSMIRLWRKKV